MKTSIRKGFGFGLTSSIITTLGLIVGLDSGTHSKMIILGGILIIAIADSLSDSLGIHISEEFENKHTSREIWESTFSTLFSKLLFTLTFAVPILLFPLSSAIIINVIWGLSLITVFSYRIACEQKTNCLHVISEHLIITIAVIILTYYFGGFISLLG